MQAGKGWRRLDGQIEDPSHSLEIFGKAKRVVPKLQKPLTLVHKILTWTRSSVFLNLITLKSYPPALHPPEAI